MSSTEQPDERLIDRLRSAHHLLTSGGGVLSGDSDARSVALMVTQAQDAAELVLCAVAEHIGVLIEQRDGFEDVLKKLISKASELGFQSPKRHAPFLRDLNGRRIAFKHHGVLPEVSQNHKVTTRAGVSLNEICEECCGFGLFEVDTSHLIRDVSIKRLLQRSRKLQKSGDYRASLEHVCMAMNRASRTVIPGMITVGRGSTEDALMLSGYGINPATYLALQKLLPGRWPRKPGEFTWDRREYGHEGNWTEEHAIFAIDTAIDLILKLQGVEERVSVSSFHDCFEDLITITKDNSDVRAYEMSETDESPREVPCEGVYRSGHKIYCRVWTADEAGGESRRFRRPGDLGAWIVAYSPRSAEGTPSVVSQEEGHLYIRADDVELSDELLSVRVFYQWLPDAWLDEDEFEQDEPATTG